MTRKPTKNPARKSPTHVFPCPSSVHSCHPHRWESSGVRNHCANCGCPKNEHLVTELGTPHPDAEKLEEVRKLCMEVPYRLAGSFAAQVLAILDTPAKKAKRP